jgi:hypothetical protein
MPIKIVSKKNSEAGTETTLLKAGKSIAESAQTLAAPELDKVGEDDGIPWCTVGVNMAYTKNMGNYESTKIGVHLSAPAKAEEVEEVFNTAKDWVEKKLTELLAQLDDSAG